MGYQATVKDQPDLTIPEDTFIRARLADIVHEKVEYTDKKTGQPASFEKLNWWFEVLDERFPGRKVKGETDVEITTHPRNRFRNWATALLNRSLPEGVALDTDDLVGLACEITVRHERSKKDDRVFERIDEVTPVSGWTDEPPF